MNIPFDLPDNVGIEAPAGLEAPAGPGVLEAGALGGALAMDPMGVTAPGWLNGIQLTTLPVRQRILSFMADQRARHDAKKDDAGVQNALALMERENARLQDLQQRHQSAMERLAQVAPTPKAPEPSTGELAASLLAGLLTGRQEDANKMLLARAAERGQRDLMADTAQFQAGQRAAGLDADFLQGQMNRSQGMLDRLETYRLGREADLIDRAAANEREDQRWKDQVRAREQERADRLSAADTARWERAHDSLLGKLDAVKNPAQIPTLVGQINDYRRRLGQPLIGPDELSGLTDEVTRRSQVEGAREIRMLRNQLPQYATAYLGEVPDEIIDMLNESIASVAEEYGMQPPAKLPYLRKATIRGEDIRVDNTRADTRNEFLNRMTEQQIKESESRIQVNNAKVNDMTSKLWKSGDVDGFDMAEVTKELRKSQTEIRKIRGLYTEKKRQFDAMSAGSDDDRRAKGLQGDYEKLRAELRDLQAKESSLQNDVYYLEESLKEARKVQRERSPKFVGPIMPPGRARLPAVKGQVRPANPSNFDLSRLGKDFGL